VEQSPDAYSAPLTAADARMAAAEHQLFAAPCPTPGIPPGPSLAQIIARYGSTWEITLVEPASLIAIRRPTPTSQDILVAHSLAELDRKLAAESGPGEDVPTWSIEVVPGPHSVAVDLRSGNHLPGDEVLHVSAAEWAEFIAAVRDGKFDDVTSAD